MRFTHATKMGPASSLGDGYEGHGPGRSLSPGQRPGVGGILTHPSAQRANRSSNDWPVGPTRRDQLVQFPRALPWAWRTNAPSGQTETCQEISPHPTKIHNHRGEAADHAFHTRHAPMALILSHLRHFSLTTKNSLSFPLISSHLLPIPRKIRPPTRTRIAQFMQQTDKFVSQTDEFDRNLSLFRHPNHRRPGSPFGATREPAIASDDPMPPQRTARANARPTCGLLGTLDAVSQGDNRLEGLERRQPVVLLFALGQPCVRHEVGMLFRRVVSLGPRSNLRPAGAGPKCRGCSRPAVRSTARATPAEALRPCQSDVGYTRGILPGSRWKGIWPPVGK